MSCGSQRHFFALSQQFQFLLLLLPPLLFLFSPLFLLFIFFDLLLSSLIVKLYQSIDLLLIPDDFHQLNSGAQKDQRASHQSGVEQRATKRKERVTLGREDR